MAINKWFICIIAFQLIPGCIVFAQKKERCSNMVYFKELDLLFSDFSNKNRIRIDEARTYQLSKDSIVTLYIMDCHGTAFGYLTVRGERQIAFMYKGHEDTISDILVVKDRLGTNEIVEYATWYYQPQLISWEKITIFPCCQ